MSRVDEDGAVAERILPDGRELVVYRQMFTHKLMIGWPGLPWGDDVWCYATRSAALAAMAEWDGEGEPAGWTRHPATGRRRPEGDPAQEYVRE